MKCRAMLILALMGAAVVLLSSGVALATLPPIENTIECNTGRVCTGTEARDLMKGTDGHNKMYAKGAADALKGFGKWDLLYGEGGHDHLYGGGGSDELYGGDRDDQLYGGGGSDKLYGGAYVDNLFPGRGDDAVLDGGEEEDTYYFETNGWGNDKITDSDTGHQLTSGNELKFLSSIDADLRIFLVSKPGRHEVSNTAGSTLNWDGSDVIKSVTNYGAGDDKIYGNEADTFIASLHGGDNDAIYGGGGDEYINVFDGSGGDYVDCGESANDRDAVARDRGDRVVNCESKTPQ